MKGFVTVEINLGQIHLEVERSVRGQAPCVLVGHAGGTIITPDRVLASTEGNHFRYKIACQGAFYDLNQQANQIQHPLDDLLRTDRIPHIWCPGCGIGTAFRGLPYGHEDQRH